MEIFDIELNDVNGGSFRVYVKHKDGELEGFPNAKERLQKQRNYEEEMGLNDKKVYNNFAKKIKKIKTNLVNFLRQENFYLWDLNKGFGCFTVCGNR